MYKLKNIIMILILSLTLFPIQLEAVDFSWTEGHYDLPLPGISGINILDISNDVTVTMNEGGVHQFSMYDNSELTIYGGLIDYLNLYDNATATFFGGDMPGELYIDPAATSWVKLYAYDIIYVPINPYGEGILMGNWLNVPYGTFNFDLRGSGAHDKIQIVPEPASLALLALGSLTILLRRKDKI
jgi:hypothetical protein